MVLQVWHFVMSLSAFMPPFSLKHINNLWFCVFNEQKYQAVIFCFKLMH